MSEQGVPDLAELVVKFPIDWHSNLKTLIFDHFSQKKNDVTPYKKCENWSKIKFFEK